MTRSRLFDCPDCGQRKRFAAYGKDCMPRCETCYQRYRRSQGYRPPVRETVVDIAHDDHAETCGCDAGACEVDAKPPAELRRSHGAYNGLLKQYFAGIGPYRDRNAA